MLKKSLNILIGFSILLIIWQILVVFGKYNEYFLPSPIKVFFGIIELITDGSLFIHIRISLFRFFVGYILAIFAGITLGLLLGWLTKLWGVIDPIVQFIRPISPIAWFPFIVLWFGIGDLPAIVVIFIASFFPILLSTISAVQKINPIYLKIAKNFGIKQPYVFSKIIFPAAFPYIMIGLHLALGAAWIFLVAGEMVGAQSGLGFLIIDSRNNLRTDLVLAGIIFIGVLGVILDKLIKILENWILKNWGMEPSEKDVL